MYRWLRTSTLIVLTMLAVSYSEFRDDDGYLVERFQTRNGVTEVRDSDGYLIRTERIEGNKKIYRDQDGYLIGTRKYGR